MVHRFRSKHAITRVYPGDELENIDQLFGRMSKHEVLMQEPYYSTEEERMRRANWLVAK